MAGAAIVGCASTSPAPSRSQAAKYAPPAKVTACDLLSVSTIAKLTGLTLGGGTSRAGQSADTSICNWESPGRSAEPAVVQLQLRRGDGRAAFDAARGELVAASPDQARSASVPGADAAYEVADQGIVAVRVGGSFLQVATIGGSFDTRQHLALASAAVKELTK
jgi:hypothetical protein